MGTNQVFFTAVPGEANLDSYEGQGSLQNQWGKIAMREELAEKQQVLIAFCKKGLEIEKTSTDILSAQRLSSWPVQALVSFLKG